MNIDAKIAWAISQMMDKLHPAFYGSFTITFKAGTLQCVKCEEIAQPPG